MEKDWPNEFQVRVMSVDPSKGAKDTQGDYCAIVFMGLCHEMLYVDANLEPRNAKDIVRAVRQFAAVRRPEAIGFETDQFQQLLADQMQADAPDMFRQWTILQMPTKGVPKEVRIRRLSPYITDRRFKFRETPGCRLLVDQLIDFPTAEKDDGPDALEQALRVLYHVPRNRDVTGGRRQVGHSCPTATEASKKTAKSRKSESAIGIRLLFGDFAPSRFKNDG